MISWSWSLDVVYVPSILEALVSCPCILGVRTIYLLSTDASPTASVIHMSRFATDPVRTFSAGARLQGQSCWSQNPEPPLFTPLSQFNCSVIAEVPEPLAASRVLLQVSLPEQGSCLGYKKNRRMTEMTYQREERASPRQSISPKGSCTKAEKVWVSIRSLGVRWLLSGNMDEGSLDI